MKDNYKTIFTTVMEADVADFENDSETFANSFDTESEFGAEDFSTEPDTPGYASAYIEKAKQWIQKIDEFSEWINGTDESSLNYNFVKLDKEGSTFEGISKHSNKLTKIAEDLAALTESIKGIILYSDKKEEEQISSDEGL